MVVRAFPEYWSKIVCAVTIHNHLSKIFLITGEGGGGGGGAAFAQYWSKIVCEVKIHNHFSKVFFFYYLV